MTEAKRKEFEALYRECFPVAAGLQDDLFELEDSEYVQAKVHVAFTIWSAARATPADHSASLTSDAPVDGSLLAWAKQLPLRSVSASSIAEIKFLLDHFEATRNAAPQPPQNAADHIVDANKKVDAQSVPVAINETMAEEMGANGSPHSEPERLLFEAYCRGHCWAVGEWNGNNYVDMADRIRFAYWRDRAALGCAPQPEAQSVRDAERYRYLTSRVVMTDASTPGITVITFVDDAIDEPNRFLDEIVDAGLKSAPPQKPVRDEVKP